MKNKNNKISKKKFLEIWKNYNDFELITSSITEEVLDEDLKMLNFKGEIKAFMKTTKKNNEDKLDLIINKISNIETRIDKIETRIDNIETRMDDMQNQINAINIKVDNGFKEINSKIDDLKEYVDNRFDLVENRLDRLESCPTIKHELNNV